MAKEGSKKKSAKSPSVKRKSRSSSKKDGARDFFIYELKLLAVIGFTVLSAFSMHTDAAGSMGKTIRSTYLGLFSYAGYILPYVLFVVLFLLINRNTKIRKKRYIFSSISLFLSVLVFVGMVTNAKNAGMVGNFVSKLVIDNIGLAGGYILSMSFLLAAVISGSNITLERIFKGTSSAAVTTGKKIAEGSKKTISSMDSLLAEKTDENGEVIDRPLSAFRFSRSVKKFDYDSYDTEDKAIDKSKGFDMYEAEIEGQKPAIESVDYEREIAEAEIGEPVIEEADMGIYSDLPLGIRDIYDDAPEHSRFEPFDSEILSPEELIEEEAVIETEIHAFEEHVKKIDYKLPPISLLEEPKAQKGADKKDLYAKAKLLEDTLNNFGVEVKVVQITRGPSITMFELQPSPGVKVSKIVGLSDDIALSLAATQVRIIAPIPGKSAVGVEIPNDDTSIVVMREIIESSEYLSGKSKLTFALGKDIQGTSVTGDLSKMPHLLIAGATGSGKSVCVNTFITSILYNASPDEVKFLMIDPKVVELSIYNGIPHLLLPVVTDPKKAAIALNWAVQEMTRRYGLFAESHVRDVNSYNEKADGKAVEKLPKIVVIIDELADLMMVAPNQIEDSICRLAQMARAAGIHLLVATQRPSVDVITGLIKANIPSRIAFAVSSQTDSRTILDMGGAEKLLGKGDMLYFPVGVSKPIRVQGAFISDSEVSRIVEFVSGQDHEASYNEEIIENGGDVSSEPTDADDLLSEAVDFVIRSKQASASMLQRKYRIGYNRAARIIDQMEERGIVGPSLGSKPREVLVTEDELEIMNGEL